MPDDLKWRLARRVVAFSRFLYFVFIVGQFVRRRRFILFDPMARVWLRPTAPMARMCTPENRLWLSNRVNGGWGGVPQTRLATVRGHVVWLF